MFALKWELYFAQITLKSIPIMFAVPYLGTSLKLSISSLIICNEIPYFISHCEVFFYASGSHHLFIIIYYENKNWILSV